MILLAVLGLAACTGSTAATGPSPSTSVVASSSPSPAASAAGSETPSPGASPTSPAASVCRNPVEHVYHPDRLELRNPCMTVTGVIDRIKEEPDGDYHVRLHLDPQFMGVINDVNVQQQAGDLILEPVCIHAITQADAVSACTGFASSLVMPPPQTHVVATGAYVLDTGHGWMELHPLWDIHPG
jgi:hypothetical protein